MFLNGLQQQHDGTRSALGLFGRIRTARANTGHAGEIEMKRYAIQPVVAAVRLLALASGVSATGTRGRVQALAEKGVVKPDDAEDILNAFGVVCDILLRRQIEGFKAGEPVTNYVAPASLRRSSKRDLRNALRVIDLLTARVRAEFTGGTL